MQCITVTESAIAASDIGYDTQLKRLNNAMARFSTLESSWLDMDIATRRDIRQAGAADSLLLAGALEHRPSESSFDGSNIPNVVLTTIAGYKQQIELVPVVPTSYQVITDAVAALDASRLTKETSDLEQATKLIDRVLALVDDLEDRMKQRESNMSKKSLPKLTEVQLQEAWNQVCELWQRGIELGECIDRVKQQLDVGNGGGGEARAETVVGTKMWFKYDSANYEPRTWKKDLKK